MIPRSSVFTRNIQKNVFENFKLGNNPKKEDYRKFYNEKCKLTGTNIEDLVETVEKLYKAQTSFEDKTMENKTLYLHGDASDEGYGFLSNVQKEVAISSQMGTNNKQFLFQINLKMKIIICSQKQSPHPPTERL